MTWSKPATGAAARQGCRRGGNTGIVPPQWELRTALDLLSRNQFQPLLLGQRGNAQRLSLGRLAAGIRPDHHIVGLRRNGPCYLGPQRLGSSPSLRCG